MGLGDAVNTLIGAILGLGQTGPPEFDWDDRPIDDSGKKVEDGDKIMLAAKQVDMGYDGMMLTADMSTGYIGYDDKEGGQWAKFYKVSGDETFDPQKAIVFTIKKTERWRIALEADVGGSTKTLTSNGDWVNFFPNNGTRAYKNTSTGWRATKAGYALYFEARKDSEVDHGQVYHSGNLSHRGGDLTVIPMKYKPPPGAFGWKDRPLNDAGVQVEDGDKIWLKAEYDITVQETANLGLPMMMPQIPTGKSHVEHRSGFVSQYQPDGTWVADIGNLENKKIFFTVRKSKENTTTFECILGGEQLTLASFTENSSAGTFHRMAMIKDSKWLDASTGWEKADKGYLLYFQSHQTTAVHKVGILQVREEGELVYFSIMRAK